VFWGEKQKQLSHIGSRAAVWRPGRGQRLLVSIDNSGISTVAIALIPVAALFFDE